MTLISNGANLVGTKVPTFTTLKVTKSVPQILSSDTFFSNKRVVMFSVPGAFTPTCSTRQLPDFITSSESILNCNIDNIYCLSVNDTYVLNAWFTANKVKNIDYIPDPTGEFTERLGMLVEKSNLGLGKRSWRYAMVVNNKTIEQVFLEPGISNNIEKDPYFTSSPSNILDYLHRVLKHI